MHAGLPSSLPWCGCSPQSRNKKKPRSRELLQTSRDHRISQHSPETRSAPSCSSALRAVSSQSPRQEKEKKKSLQNPPTPPVSSRIRGINVEIVARRCSSTSEMKYLLLKVEKRCQTTIEKILKSIVDERRSPNLLAARIWPWPAGAAARTTLALRGCPRTTTLAYDRALISKGCRTHGLPPCFR